MFLTEFRNSIFQAAETKPAAVGPHHAPIIKKTLVDQSVKFGEMANFETSVEPVEVAVHWYSNDRELTQDMPGTTTLMLKFTEKRPFEKAA